MEPNEVTAQIVDAAVKIHTQLGPGLLETVYEVTLAHELRKRGLRVRRQVPIAIELDGLKFDEGCRIDLLVEESVVVESKSVEKNPPVHPKQRRTHLVLAKLRLGCLNRRGQRRKLSENARAEPQRPPRKMMAEKRGPPGNFSCLKFQMSLARFLAGVAGGRQPSTEEPAGRMARFPVLPVLAYVNR
jgi:GxxExxY protein